MTLRQHPSVDTLDELVRKAQELADLYVRALDINPSALVDKVHDAEQVDLLLQALARFFLAERHAVDAVASYAAGVFSYEPPESDDF